MDIKILGSGCAKCQTLEETTQRTLDELGIDAPIDHVRDDVDVGGALGGRLSRQGPARLPRGPPR